MLWIIALSFQTNKKHPLHTSLLESHEAIICIFFRTLKSPSFFCYSGEFATKVQSISFDSISSEPDSVILDSGGKVPFLASGAIDFKGLSCQVRNYSD